MPIHMVARRSRLLAAGSLLAAPAAAAAQPEPADLVLRNARVYTANDKQPKAEAVAVKGDKIVFVGGNRDAARLVGPATKVVDLAGAAVFPGFTDAHMHLPALGEREMNLNLEGTNTLEEFLARVKARVDQAKPGQWVTGRGWIETF